MSLKKKTVGGLFWSGIDSVGLNVIRVVISVVLARILEPTDFGLIAILNIFISLADTLMQGGFSTALIRKVNIKEIDYSTVFIFNFVLSFSLYWIIFFLSSYIAIYFEQPVLKPIAKVVALVLVFHSIGIVQQVKLKRLFDFKTLAVINIISTILSGAIGIGMALSDYGVWSLVFQLVSKSAISSLMLWVLGSWKFSFSFDYASFKENFNFGYKLSIAGVINSLAFNAYNVVIGKMYNTSILGFFFQAKRLSDVPQTIISNIFKSVSFPVLSSIQDDENRFKKAYLQFLRSAAFLAFPIMMLLIVIAEPLILVSLTKKWSASIPYFQLLCINGLFIPLIVISGNIPLIKGRSDIFLKLEVYYKVQMMIFLVITATIGVTAIVIGLVIQIIIQFIVNLIFVSKFIDISIFDHFKSLADLFIIALIVAFISFLFNFVITNSILLILIQIIVFILLYVTINYFLKSKELFELKNILSDKLFSKSNI